MKVYPPPPHRSTGPAQRRPARTVQVTGRFLLFVLLAGTCAALVRGLDRADTAPESSGLFERLIARTVAARLERLHYARRDLDDDISAELFDEYFDFLDPQRYYFLQSDIDSFRHARKRLDDQLNLGRIHFAYEVYDLYRRRVGERIEKIRESMAQQFDFERDEYIVVDRSELPWCTTTEQLDEAWRLRLKNEVLTYRLADEEEEARAEKKKENETEDKQQTDRRPSEDNGPQEPDSQANGRPPEQTTATPPQKPSGDTPPPPPLDGADPAPDADETQTPSHLSETPEERVLKYHEHLYELVEARESIEILELFLNALSNRYDPHSAYMAPDTDEDFDIHMKLSLQGIGALLSDENGYTKVVEIIPGGPADLDGRLKPNDLIVAVAQGRDAPVDVVGLPIRKVVKLIRGRKGTTVVLTVIEGAKGMGSTPTRIDIIRDEVKLTEQAASGEVLHMGPMRNLLDSDPEAPPPQKSLRMLVVTLPSFYLDFEARRAGKEDYASASRDVAELIDAEKRKPGGVDGVVLDLRGNGGGSLDEAIRVAGLFFPAGPVVQARYSDGSTVVHRDRDGESVYDGPLVVLVDRMSASASEIVAAAIQDCARGVVIGDHATHGKGTIQTLQDLEDDFRRVFFSEDNRQPGSLKLTVGKFYRINGGATQLKGVVPDIAFESFTDHMELGESELPNALPWDAIEPLTYKQWFPVEPFLAELKSRSQKRTNQDELYAALRDDIALYQQQREANRLPLNKRKREQVRAQQEQLADKIRQLNFRRNRRDNSDEEPDNGGENTVEFPDFVRNEALKVLADLADLQSGALQIPGTETDEEHVAGDLPTRPPEVRNGQ